jgi:pilus assembly protein CpaC
MRPATTLRHGSASPLIAACTAAMIAAFAFPASAASASSPPAPAQTELPARTVTMSVGSGQLVHLPRPITGIFIADDKIADVQVKSPTQLYLFAKSPGETSVYATDRAGKVVWSSNVRAGNNLADVGGMLKLAMPDATITATPVGGMVLLTGKVRSPKDVEEAQRLTETFTSGAQVLNRLRTATPLQVSLHVKIAEVSRNVAKTIGVNLANRDHGNFIFGIGQGDAGKITTITSDLDPASGASKGDTAYSFSNIAGTTLGIAGHALGMDILSTLQLAETNGLATMLAEPNLTAISRETASFLAGGEIPIPQSQGLGTVSVEYKQYGVSLSFTPFVLADGQISLRVRPEVSQLSDAGSVKVSGFTIPSLTTRRADTTVELGSGQSFVIGGLLQNNHNNTTDKAPFLGDLPILGALFRSNSFRKEETELVIVVTPYLVKPVDAKQIALPTDGYRAPTTVERVLLGRDYGGQTGGQRPVPTQSQPGPVTR